MHDTTLRRSLMLAASLMALAAPAVADDEAPTLSLIHISEPTRPY